MSLNIPVGRIQYVESLLVTLDALIFVELAIAFYISNRTFLLILRIACQIFYVQQHKIENIETPAQLPPVLITNAICLIINLVSGRPQATIKASHGWQHGGVIIDLIGERGPISKWRLLAQDLLILTLQIVMLAVGHERHVIETGEKDGQTIEAEEAGVRTSQEGAAPARAEEPHETEEGIEMQSFLPSTEGATSTAVDTEEDVILTLNVRRSLKGLLARTSDGAEGQADSAIDRAAERADRLRVMLQRLAASRAG